MDSDPARWGRDVDGSTSRPEQPPVGNRPHARRERFDLTPARDDQAEPPCIPREAPNVDGARDLRERARADAAGATSRLDLDREEAVAGVGDDIDFAARVGAEEVTGAVAVSNIAPFSAPACSARGRASAGSIQKSFGLLTSRT